MFRLNVTAQIMGAQVAARAMRARGRGGSILVLGSIDSLDAAPGGSGACRFDGHESPFRLPGREKCA